MHKTRVLIVLCTLLVLASSAMAYQGKPPKSFALNVVGLEQVDHKTLPAFNLEDYLLEDEAKSNDFGPGAVAAPYRVAVARPVALGPALQGTWEELSGGARLWRLRVTSPDAVFLSFLLRDFEMPWGAELRFVSVDRDDFVGPYTLRNNNSERIFRSPPVAGDSVVIELYLPAGVDAPSFRVGAVSHGYEDFNRYAERPLRSGRVPGLDTLDRGVSTKALACEVDVNCSEGNGWGNEINSVARTFDGNFLCTGQMVNDADGSCRNLFLTANHCLKSKGKAAGVVFLWNFQRPGCESGTAPTSDTTTGSTLLATAPASDFTLVELTEAPPDSYNVYHTGWDRSGATPSEATAIHHPNGDEKKISFEFDPLEDGQQSGWGNDHWRVTGWDVGTTEGGSSGGAIWDSAKRVVGQLHGGTGDCDGGWDEYGKLSVSWTLGADAVLDPSGTGASAIDGKSCVGGGNPPPTCEAGQKGDPCTVDSDCCSMSCKGKQGAKTCK